MVFVNKENYANKMKKIDYSGISMDGLILFTIQHSHSIIHWLNVPSEKVTNAGTEKKAPKKLTQRWIKCVWYAKLAHARRRIEKKIVEYIRKARNPGHIQSSFFFLIFTLINLKPLNAFTELRRVSSSSVCRHTTSLFNRKM